VALYVDGKRVGGGACNAVSIAPKKAVAPAVVG
jgi:hypothetical protein